jgi:hypothetical protein
VRGTITLVGLLAVATAACGNLGIGEADCTPHEQGVSSANVMTVQAVPSAKYTPCLDELRLGWDEVQWFAEDGRAGIEIFHSFEPFLKVTVTESCDVSDADRVESGYPDIDRYEDVESQAAEIGITIVPAAEGPLLRARLHVDDLARTEIDDRPVVFTIDDRIDRPIRARVNLALLENQVVWIIDELDAEEGTVEVRGDDPLLSASGLTPRQALDLIEESAPGVFYRGSWFFIFEGGCITYEFNATGNVAETVAEDADDALGFYPAFELREMARRDGYDVGG